MAFTNRYRDAGLTHNPFAAWQVGDPPLAGFVDRGIPSPPPPGSRTLVQVIGESGIGKSTQLGRWRGLTPGPLHYIPRSPYRDRFKTPPLADPDRNIVYGDEIDRMPAMLRWRWFRQLASDETTLVIGTHDDLTTLGERSGFAVVTHRLSPVTRPLLAEMIEQRMQQSSCGPIDVRFSDDDFDRILETSGGNPREADVLCHQILADYVSRR